MSHSRLQGPLEGRRAGPLRPRASAGLILRPPAAARTSSTATPSPTFTHYLMQTAAARILLLCADIIPKQVQEQRICIEEYAVG